MEQKKAYILLLNWNGWKDTVECVNSILNNTYSNYQIVIVDNDSQDNSVEKIKNWIDQDLKELVDYIEYNREQIETGIYEKGNGAKDGNQIVIIQSKRNYGFADGNNLGLQYILGQGDAEYVWLLNNDTVIEKDSLTYMVSFAESNASVGLVGAKLLYYDEPNRIQTLGGGNNVTWKNAGEWIKNNELENESNDQDFELTGYVCGASIFVKKNVIEDIGLLDPNFFMWVEEVEWCIRASKLGHKMAYCSKAKVWHKEGASTSKNHEKSFLGRKSKRLSLSRFVVTNYYGIRNQTYLVNKHFARYKTNYLLYTFFVIIKRIMGIIVFDDHKKIRIYLLFKALYDGLTNNMGKTVDPKNIIN